MAPVDNAAVRRRCWRRLATWNVQRLTRTTSVRMSRVRPYLDAINADIWVLTETGEPLHASPTDSRREDWSLSSFSGADS